MLFEVFRKDKIQFVLGHYFNYVYETSYTHLLYGADVPFNGLVDTYEVLFEILVDRYTLFFKQKNFKKIISFLFPVVSGPVLSHYCMYMYEICYVYHLYGTVVPFYGLTDRCQIHFKIFRKNTFFHFQANTQPLSHVNA